MTKISFFIWWPLKAFLRVQLWIEILEKIYYFKFNKLENEQLEELQNTVTQKVEETIKSKSESETDNETKEQILHFSKIKAKLEGNEETPEIPQIEKLSIETPEAKTEETEAAVIDEPHNEPVNESENTEIAPDTEQDNSTSQSEQTGKWIYLNLRVIIFFLKNLKAIKKK